MGPCPIFEKPSEMYLKFLQISLKNLILRRSRCARNGAMALFEIPSEIYLIYQNVLLKNFNLRRTICYSAMPSMMYLP
jgi:hypothetical protein